jgi:hypothetical protein
MLVFFYFLLDIVFTICYNSEECYSFKKRGEDLWIAQHFILLLQL